MSSPPRSTAATVTFPRVQSGSNPQRLLGALLADYTFESTPGLSSPSVIAVLGEFGISEAGARSALSRVTARGLLNAERSGRQVRYVLGSEARATHGRRLSNVVRFGHPATEWDGMWTVVLYSLPEAQRSLRQRWRTQLEQLKYGCLTDAAWISAHDTADEVQRLSAEHGVGAAVLRAQFLDALAPGLRPQDAFDLEAVRRLHTDFIETFAPVRDALDAGRIGPERALVERTRVLNDWRLVAVADPDLPRAVLPADWPLADARAIFLDLWRGLAPAALMRLQALIRARDSDTARQLRWMDVPTD